MPGTMRVIAVDGTVIDTPYDRDPPLEDLHAAIGPIEAIPHFTHLPDDPGQPCAAYVGEEAKGFPNPMTACPENVPATDMWDRVLRARGLLKESDTIRNHGDYLAGPVVLVFGDRAFMRSMVE